MDIDAGADKEDLQQSAQNGDDNLRSGPGGVQPEAHEQLHQAPVKVRAYGRQAGAIINEFDIRVSAYREYQLKVNGSTDNPYAPFACELDWDLARWAKLRNISASALNELLSIKGIVEKLGLSYKNSGELNRVIDEQLPLRRPAFVHHEATVMGEKFDMYARDIMQCILALYGDAEHARYLCIMPERHYADADETIRLYHDLHTGRWWWDTQKIVEAKQAGGTIVPVILSSDKTQITLFRNKTAYPVYLTIGNLPKSIRRKPGRQGQILLAYLPTTRLEHITNQAARRRVLGNLFHACMKILVQPLEIAGLDGVPMMSGDGVWRRCHPILAVYIGDYPEQCLVGGAYTGDCPVCHCHHNDLEEFPCTASWRDAEEARDALEYLGSDDFAQKCRDANIKPLQHPFWEFLPYTDIYQSITPDVLHQLYQGVFKHLLSWLKEACGAAEIDARVSRLPPGHGVRIFWKGITKLSRVSGAEHKQISRFLLAIVVDMPLAEGRAATARLVRATWSLLDFLYLAQYPTHTSDTLTALHEALSSFHAERDIFIELGVRSGFNIPKLHFLQHYARFIKQFGTTDNYNTETTERLHIDFAKDAYRATNHRDEYPQMTKWLERREKVLHHANYVLWRLQQVDIGPNALFAHHGIRWEPPDLSCPLHIKMTLHPTRKAVPLTEIVSRSRYGATFFVAALARFVTEYVNPTLTSNQVERLLPSFRCPFETLPVYHRIKFWNEAVYGKETLDSIQAHPRSINQSGDIIVPSRFDTALIRVINEQDDAEPQAHAHTRRGLDGLRVAQVRVVFTLPQKAVDQFFRDIPEEQRPPRHLAYVEWLTKFPARPERDSKLYKLKWAMTEGGRLASVLPVAALQRSVHLTPKWNGPVNLTWTSENVLKKCDTFLLNVYKDPRTQFNVY